MTTQTIEQSSKGRGLFWFALILVFCTYFLLIAGGLVTSNEAGLAVPDWPLSYGQAMPPMVGNIFWEHGHRMIAGVVGILTLLLALATQFKEKRSWMKKLTWVAFAAVVIQALFGGLTVLLMLPPPVSIVHACLGQTFFCILIAIAFGHTAFFKSSREIISHMFGRTKRLFLITTCMIFIQLILGATARHTEFTVVPHIILAFIVLFHVALMARHATTHYIEENFLVRPTSVLAMITVAQLFLGFGAFVTTRMMERGYAPPKQEVWLTAAHQSVGAAILGLCFFSLFVIWTKGKQNQS